MQPFVMDVTPGLPRGSSPAGMCSQRRTRPSQVVRLLFGHTARHTSPEVVKRLDALHRLLISFAAYELNFLRITHGTPKKHRPVAENPLDSSRSPDIIGCGPSNQYSAAELDAAQAQRHRCDDAPSVPSKICRENRRKSCNHRHHTVTPTESKTSTGSPAYILKRLRTVAPRI